MKSLSFATDRASKVPLVDQVVQGIRSAVHAGYYQPGDRLPSIAAMASLLGVGQQTVRRAVQELANEGHIVARRRQGIRIVDRRRGLFQRHVLHLRFGGSSYYFSTRYGHLEELLGEHQVRVTAVAIHGREFQAGLPHLKSALASHHFDLTIVDGPADGLIGELRAANVAFVCAGDPQPVDLAAGNICVLHRPSLEALAAHCRGLGIRTAEILTITVAGSRLVEEVFAAAEIGCRVLSATATGSDGKPGTVERLGYRLMRSRLDSPNPLPDLIFVTDDYLARGALMAIACAGLDIPGDLQLACHLNAGYEPAFPRDLTRIVTDPYADARLLADLVLAVLDDPSGSQRTFYSSPFFVPGATTRTVPLTRSLVP